MRKLLLGLVTLTLLAATIWTGIYLFRWEWTRALWTAMVFVAAEIALFGLVLAGKIDRLDARRPTGSGRTSVHTRLAETRPEPHRFAWLDEQVTRTNVFVTMMVGGGMVVSGVLWVIDLIAGRSVTEVRESGLADELSGLAFPHGGLVPPDPDPDGSSIGSRSDVQALLFGTAEPRP